jgi:hypothetical protein
MSQIDSIVVRLENDKVTDDPIIMMAINPTEDGARKKYKIFDLTRKGCVAAGEFMGRAYIDDDEIKMRLSSSVDFPCDVKKRCRLDVRGIIQSACEKIIKADQECTAVFARKMLAVCNPPEFIGRLSDREKVRHKKICAEYGIKSLCQ